MALILHIIIALSSLAIAGYVFFRPSKRMLGLSYALVALTLVSGTYLVVTLHAPLLRACATGLVYLAVALGGNLAAQRRLSNE